MNIKLLILGFLLPINIFSQTEKFTLSGYVRDDNSGEELFGVSIYEKESFKGSTTNFYGFYSITLPAGTYDFVFSYIGYKTFKKQIVFDKNIELNINLKEQDAIGTVVVKGSKTSKEQVHETSKTSTISIPIAQMEQLPNIGGEVDVLKTLQLLPGVQSGSEGSSGLYVRGGGPDQNLILLDGVPVYNASHLFGFISVFNSNAISNVELIKGGFPARYGGRLSSVIDIRMKEGNNKEFHGDVSIGILSAKATIEGPIIKGKSSFIVSGRRTYMDLFMRPILKAQSKAADPNSEMDGGYAFTDFNAKINHRFSDKDRIFWSFYYGDDIFDFGNKSNQNYEDSNYKNATKSGINYGNITSAFRYNHQFTQKLFLNTSLTYSRYKFKLGSSTEETITHNTDTTQNSSSSNKFEYTSSIEDWALKFDFDFLPHPNHYIKYGVNGIYHTFKPGVTALNLTANNVKIDTTISNTTTKSGEISIYVEDDMKIGSRLKMNLGVHGSIYYVGTKKYWSVQPRISANYKFLPKWSLKASFATMTQYLHLLTNSGIGLPTDLWVSPTEKIKPQQSWQVAGGVAHTLMDDYEFSIEGYYKQMTGLISYKDGASFLSTSGSWEDKVHQGGKGESYGAEFFVQKKKGKLTGWVGYTLSWTNRQFDELNGGKRFSYKYDRRHDFSIALMYKLGPKIDFSGTWVFGTGNAITVPESTFTDSFGRILNDYGERNGTRMPEYHRLDLGINFHKKMKVGEIIWNVSVYNVYSRQNPFFVYLGSKKDNPTEKTYKQVSLFPILPSVSFRRKF